ncbi:translation initiation factor IF-2 [Horticoccus luteus]|uniref:Translation initiation factor IF-2 n=1 Tax=Horticoccus luteus TaxID=2862869 RepID=A0A8F9TUW6_9BACT|nr:translation initiation factor IF-2 [Horticoccus luteus]QYM78214.1 translation initiation factor IF-2 [Horticoccus luteus]
MPDQETSGASAAAPQETAPASTASTPSTADATAPIGQFGSSRGSGLARGKRPASPAPAAASSAPGGYQPTQVEVINPQREYKNPFGGADVAPSKEPAPAPAAAPAPAPVAAAPQVPVQPAPAPRAPIAAAPTPVAPTPAAPAEKAELKILPPAQERRPAQSWEHSGFGRGAAAPSEQNENPRPPRRDDRGTFRPERREQKFEPRAPRPPQEPRPAQDPRPPREPRPAFRQKRDQPAPAKKPGGFLGWLKGLFGGTPAPEAPPARPQPGDERRRDGDRYRDGRRSDGRQRHGGEQGRQNFEGNRGPRPEGGEFRRDGQDGEQQHRRRRRGGRGRNRGGDYGNQGGDRGDRRDRGPNPEGQQGGGAI